MRDLVRPRIFFDVNGGARRRRGPHPDLLNASEERLETDLSSFAALESPLLIAY
jgi:hypothetical protein